MSANLSVVIVNYNSGDMLTDCVKRLLTSTITLTIFIVDNASSDDSLSRCMQAIEHPMPDGFTVQVLQHEKNLGFSKANNAVFSSLTTDYVLYLNPDCLVQAETLEKCLTEIKSHPEAAMLGCLINNPDGSEQAGCRGVTPTVWRSMMQFLPLATWLPNQAWARGYTLSDQPLPQHTTAVELISGCFMLAKVQAIKQVGLLDDHYFLYCEDYDWFYRFIQQGWQILFFPAVAVIHHKATSAKQTPIKTLYHKAKGMMRYYNKFFRRKYNIPLNVMVMLSIWLRFICLSLITLLKVKKI